MGGGDLGARFSAALALVGADRPPRALLSAFPAPCGAPGARLALESCEFFALFAADPRAADSRVAKSRYGRRSRSHQEPSRQRQFDFRLRPDEREALAADGALAVARLRARSFAEVYYRLYSDDLPVFVTADSVLHAWHRSLDAFVLDLEAQALVPALATALERALAHCRGFRSTRGPVRQLADVELFLFVALDLLDGGRRGDPDPELAARVNEIRDAVEAEKMTTTEVFGGARIVDFSLFKPRGHYSKSQELAQYFRAVMWVGTIDFRVAGGDDAFLDQYQLQCAVVLVCCLRQAGSLGALAQVDLVISALFADGDVGADSLTPSKLDSLLRQIDGECSTDDVLDKYVCQSTSAASLKALQDCIAACGKGAQLISGHPHVESESSSSTPTALPTSFALLGQRFVWSSFVFSRLVFDQVTYNEEKVRRRVPSAVDVAFSLFGNNIAGEVMAARMEAQPRTKSTQAGHDSEFVRHRDGLVYASNAMALRRIIDEEFSCIDEGTASISTLWIQALRELSKPAGHSSSTFHSRTWQLRQMNTQLASFAQLRHDSVLYAKQSYTLGTRCEYAAGFVDPYPNFWAKMTALSSRTADLVRDIQTLGDSELLFWDRAFEFFDQFANITASLADISMIQCQSRALSEEQTNFLKTVMEERFGSGKSRYLGWYPKLFYVRREDSGERDVLVADIHTDVPSIEHGDPGSILHVGVGDVLTGFFVVDNVMYAGPLFSCYEFTTAINERQSDEDFEEALSTMTPPSWATRSFLSFKEEEDATRVRVGYKKLRRSRRE